MSSITDFITLLNGPLGWLVVIAVSLYQLFIPWSKLRTLLDDTVNEVDKNFEEHTKAIREDVRRVKEQMDTIEADSEELKDVTVALARAEPRVDDDMIRDVLRDGDRGADRFLQDLATDGAGDKDEGDGPFYDHRVFEDSQSESRQCPDSQSEYGNFEDEDVDDTKHTEADS